LPSSNHLNNVLCNGNNIKTEGHEKEFKTQKKNRDNILIINNDINN